MLKSERQDYIVRRARQDGYVTTNSLVAEFGLAEDTIRKDFQDLSRRGLVKRVHGGVLRIDRDVTAFSDRMDENADAKIALARRAVDLVAGKQVLYLDGGTTVLRLAEQLPEDYAGTIITNAPAIALALSRLPHADVVVIGGSFNKTTQVMEGTEAVRQIQGFTAECCVLGISTIDATAGLTFPTTDEAVYKREVIAHCAELVAIVTANKLGGRGAFHAANIEEVDVLVTDETRPEVLDPFRVRGIEVIVQA